MAKKAKSKPKAKRTICSVSEPTELNHRKSHKFTPSKRIEKPGADDAEFADDGKDGCHAPGIEKRQDQFDSRFVEKLKTCAVEERSQWGPKEHQQREFRLNLQ